MSDIQDVRTRLAELAANFSFSWHPAVRGLFEQLDPAAWERVEHNPTALLADLPDEALARAAGDPSFRVALEQARAEVAEELARETWWQREHGDPSFLVAYFSTEFGLDESLPIYSGGLGVLAGDHLKSASDLGVPLVGVGLFYRDGYFRQELDELGRQVERYPDNDPARLALRDTGELVRVLLDGEEVAVRVWETWAGRTRLLLLDTAVEGNSERASGVTWTLYGGDREQRLRQELVLGIGGVRALAALGLEPTVFHLNEGHSAFLQLERARAMLARGVSLDDAVEQVRRTTVFTTHTPVPAGNEEFDPVLVRRYLGEQAEQYGVGWEAVFALARVEGNGETFGLTPLALRTSAYANAVSELHGRVAREMWGSLWPDRSVDEVPIGHITNGVHDRTWLGPELASALGSDADGRPRWDAARPLADEELWRIHRERKAMLLEVARRRFERQLGGRGAGRIALDPEALTIGFARRFATYKRATLLFADPARLAWFLNDPARPVQLLVAGKAHPADEGGKSLIRRLVELSRDPRFGGRVAFLEDYEMTLARALVQGVDVWLNNPRRPLEASGTSGMKAGLNGALNVSVLDGWWAEGYAPELGWAIGTAEEHPDEAEGDAADAAALLAVLEDEVIPAFYERDQRGIPRRWVAMMRESVADVGARFNTGRMVAEYVERYYLPAHAAHGAGLARR
ncbi:MAG TPA: alpha-glucan family phosphorylase [Gaiellaceae bacterium]|nr:alpha-glucan family phosphorylase [Gaiellaceae bacterium]